MRNSFLFSEQIDQELEELDQFENSNKKRSDAKLLSLALVTDANTFAKFSKT
jgi:hypothetical protein